VGTDPKSEVALIKIEDGEELPVLALGDSDALEVGEWVLAAGNPFGLSQTVTAGIVSAKERGDIGIADYANFIQTDAAINPGNSGGPLLNIDGEVVGINTAIYSQTGGYMGIGFAIPINLAVHIKDQLIQHGKVNRSVLGIVIQEVNEDLAQSFGLDNAGGILISQVLAGSAAEEAGLKAGDIILEMDGKRVGRSSSFRNRVASTPPNTQIELHIFREGEYRKIAATTKELGGEGGLSFGEVNGSTLLDKFGATVEPLDRNRAQQLGMDGLEGLLITEVDEGGPAWRAGLKTGNLITGVNRRPVYTVQEFVQALKDAREGRVLLLVSDGQCSRFFIVSLND
ncbi:MAG TPA: PDZ domain-containing protein, partial [Pontiella sp.]